jgi:hypothetical protein
MSWRRPLSQGIPVVSPLRSTRLGLLPACRPRIMASSSSSSNARGAHAGGRPRQPQEQRRGNNRWQRQAVTHTEYVRWPSESSILVVDLEATCWETSQDRPPGEANEIIEIGWALVDLTQSPPVTIQDGTILVKPTRSNVSRFCTELTTITAELLESEGVSLQEAFRILQTDLQSRELAWGR